MFEVSESEAINNIELMMQARAKLEEQNTGKRRLRGRDRKAAYARRALVTMKDWSGNHSFPLPELFAASA